MNGAAVRGARRTHDLRENAQELAQDVRSLGYDLESLVAQKRLIVDYIHVDRSEIEKRVNTISKACSRLDTPSSRLAPSA